ncbi:K(+)/H(+) antiporter NhaP2 [Alphaproteobacteria bacterium SO-S41]|nr:K(+)/H(+) antiporter NhaP2 [Alphaproteobacteria bacterium SO-S41]
MSDVAATASHVEAIAYGASGVALLLGCASLLMPAARKLALPYTVLVAAFGAAVGVLLALAPDWGGTVGRAASLFSEGELPSEAMLYLFLPPLLFAAGLHVDIRRLLDDIWPILVMAIFAVVLCCAVVGVALFPFMAPDGVSILDAEWQELLLLALLIGAVVAPTDTAAVLSIFKDIGAPRRLSTIVEGESLFNDAAAIALVAVLIAALGGDTSGGIPGAIAVFAKQLVGGLVFGYFAGRAAAWVAQLARGFVVAETTLTLTLAYVVFAVAQLALGVSGIVAVVAAAIAFGSRARTRLTPGSWDALLALWKQLDFWATTLIFVFAAMEAPEVFATFHWTDLAAIGAVYGAAILARAIVTFGVMPLLVFFHLSEPFSRSYRLVLTWGGIRGALTVVLALFAVESGAVIATGEENARLLVVIAFGYVLLTLFINAPTLRLLIRVIGMNALDTRDRLVRDRVMAVSRARVERATYEAAKGFRLEREEPVAFVPGEGSLSHDERVQVGLLTSVNREIELIMSGLERGIVERRIAELLLSHAGRLFDLTRAKGADGYREAAGRNHRITRRFRVALWLHRRLGWATPLAEEIATRYELMLVKGRLIQQLRTFAGEQMSQLIGADACDDVERLLEDRERAIQASLDAMEKQYGNYATQVRALLVERLALALEESEYRVQRQQGLISEEIYEDLESDRLSRLKALSQRPSLDLGLEIAVMVGRVPLFESISAADLGAITKLLRPELAVPREKVITAGSLGREMYFIVSGGVDVMIPGGEPVRLKGGDFFGEVALLFSQRRNADVIAVTYCELLVLRKGDLDTLMAGSPELKSRIQAYAEQRGGVRAAAE